MYDLLLSAAGNLPMNGWMNKLDLASFVDVGYGIALDSSENVYIVGKSNNDIILVKFNNLGIWQWNKGLSVGTDVGYSIAIDTSDNIFITGANSTNSILVAKYSTAGAIAWQKQLDVSGVTDIGYCITTDSSGNIFVGGGIDTGNTTGYFIIIKLTSVGATVWQISGGTASAADFIYGMVTDVSGNLYAVGKLGSGHSAIIKVSNTGTILWKRQINTTTSYGIDLDSLGNIYVVGDYNGQTASFIVKYDTAGSLLWQKQLDTTSVLDVNKCISIDINDNIYVGGKTGTTSTSAMSVYRYNTSGTCIWQRKLQLASTDADLLSIVANNNGAAYITGYFSASYIFTAKIPIDGYGLNRYLLNGSYINYFQTSLTDAISSYTEAAGTYALSLADSTSFYLKLSGTTYNVYDVVQDSSGNFYFAYSNATLLYFGIAKYNSAGTAVWSYIYNSSGLSITTNFNLAIDSSDNIYAVSSYKEGASDTNVTSGILFKIDTAGTVLKWIEIDSSAATSDDFANRLFIKGTSIYIVGQTNSNAYFAKFDNNLNLSLQSVLDTASSLDTANDICVDSSDNIYIVGKANYTTLANSYGLIVKYDSTGLILWKKKIEITSSEESCNAIAIDSSGNLYITGITAGSNIFLLRFNSTDGSNVWQKFLDNTSNIDTASCITVDNSGNILIGGQSGTVGILAKFDNNGNLIWQRKTSSAIIKNIKVYSTYTYLLDNLYGVAKLPNAMDVSPIALDTFGYSDSTLLTISDGNLTFSDSPITELPTKFCYYGAGNTASAYIDSSENTYSTAYDYTALSVQLCTVSKFDKSKAKVWQTTLGMTNTHFQSHRIIAANDGSSYVTAITTNSSFGPLIVVKLNTSGGIVWQKAITRGDGVDYYNNIALAVDSSNNLIAIARTAKAHGTNKYVFELLKFDSNGNITFKKDFYSTIGSGRYGAVVLDTSDNIYISFGNNTSTSQFGAYYTIYKFNSSGTLIFNKLYEYSDQTLEDVVSMQLDSSGNIYLLIQAGDGNGMYTGFIHKLNNAGVSVWRRIVTSSSGTYLSAGALTIDSSDNIYYSMYNNSNAAYQLYKIDTAGTILLKRYLATGSGLPACIKVIGNSEYIGGTIQIPSDGTVLNNGMFPNNNTYSSVTSVFNDSLDTTSVSEYTNPSYPITLEENTTTSGANTTLTTTAGTSYSISLKSIVGVGTVTQTKTGGAATLTTTLTNLNPTVTNTAASMTETTPSLTSTTIYT